MLKKIILILLIITSILKADYNATANSDTLGIYYQDYNFLMGLSGLLMGFTVTIVVLFLIMQVAKK
jgi:uncharacterized protein HemY